MRFALLGSGSKGNACYVEAGGCAILIDAGFSCKELISRLHCAGLDPGRVSALFITHEHTDHIKGVGPFARRFNIPVFMNRPTYNSARNTLGPLPMPVFFNTGESITFESFTLEFFAKCHDAADPVGIILNHNGLRMGLLTDVGRSTLLLEDRLKGCNALVLEFNHDPMMLAQGPYTLELKRRIRGPDGHLSNVQAARLLEVVCHDGLETLVLAHLSEVNNEPQKALQEAEGVLKGMKRDEVRIVVGSQHEPTPLLDIL